VVPNMLMQGTLRSGNRESTCKIRQQLAGKGKGSYYVDADLVDSSVSPHLEDGVYMFNYLGETNAPVEVRRENGLWLNVPPSAQSPGH